eukprot:1489912-Pyramimonas_sp.AAC.1
MDDREGRAGGWGGGTTSGRSRETPEAQRGPRGGAPADRRTPPAPAAGESGAGPEPAAPATAWRV